MLIFIDTSSLVKRYIEEDDSIKIDSLFIESNDIALSPITAVEMTSVFNRKLRDATITEETFRLGMNNFLMEMPLFKSTAMTTEILTTAMQCINTYPLKTLDALQIASAISFKPDLFVTSDKKMRSIACSILNCKCTEDL